MWIGVEVKASRLYKSRGCNKLLIIGIIFVVEIYWPVELDYQLHQNIDEYSTNLFD
jgi:hypothetical protein